MKELFGVVDNLNMFIHPKFNEGFKFMDDSKSIELAKTILKKFKESGYENIVVIESGTAPLIAIIKKLKEYKECNFKIIQVKIPRDLDFNLLEWFNTYLSKEEMNDLVLVNGNKVRRYVALKSLCKDFSLEKFIGKDTFTIYDSVNNLNEYDNSTSEFIKVLEGTEMYDLFNKPFLLFDEYINAGTIIRNFNGMVRLFNMTPESKLSAFCMFLDKPKNYEKIAFTLYDNSNELECYRNGAYPFENRIDLIGYYYFIAKNDFVKVDLIALKNELGKMVSDGTGDLFYEKLNKIIDSNNLLIKLKDSLSEEQVKNYVSNKDIIRFIFKYLDEKIYGKNKYSDFLDQVFELYAPSWSPMPVVFHLDYWNGFEEIRKDIDDVCSNIIDDYKRNRFLIIKLALESLENNYHLWKDSIDKKLGIKMKIIDISMDLNEKTVVWVDDDQPKLIPVARKPEAPINFTWLDFGSHAGTHIDAPFYLFNDKWKSDEVPFDVLIGDCQVIDLSDVDDLITVDDLKKHNIISERILLKTKNSDDLMKKYNPNHVALSEEGAKYLRDLGIKLIGYDYQSFERNGEVNIHRIFMEKNIVCLDNLRLKETEEKIYEFMCLPLKVTGIDAAPSRAILIEK